MHTTGHIFYVHSSLSGATLRDWILLRGPQPYDGFSGGGGTHHGQSFKFNSLYEFEAVFKTILSYEKKTRGGVQVFRTRSDLLSGSLSQHTHI
jgi:hypothetical protein